MLNCYSSRTRHSTAEDQTLLTTIANQVAIAIKNSQLVNQLAQKNAVKGFLDDLLHGTADSEESLRQRASFLGCDLTRAHTVVLIKQVRSANGTNEQLPDDYKKSSGPLTLGQERESQDQQDPAITVIAQRVGMLLRRRLQDQYAGSLLYEYDNQLTCLVSLPKDPTGSRLKSWLVDLAQQVQHEYAVHLAIGIGNVCQSINDYRQGFAEASEALTMGQQLTPAPSTTQPVVTHFNDLGVYRYLYKIARMDDVRDVYQDQVARIDSYDRRKNTDLLTTLETYLECAGNLTKTAERLYVHRNTLIQRLDRLQSLCDIDLQERSNWLTLQVAIKIYKLRAGEL
jgi:sugar diacid utilization regulator